MFKMSPAVSLRSIWRQLDAWMKEETGTRHAKQEELAIRHTLEDQHGEWKGPNS